MKIKKKYLLSFFLTPIFAGAFFIGILWAVIASLSSDLPSPESLQTYKPPLTTKIFDRNDSLIYEFFIERREPVLLDSIPDFLVNSLIYVEDERFYSHWGISIVDILRAMLVNLFSGRVVQGASTITQQLARNMFLTQKRVLIRKLKEAILSVQLEMMYSKEEILTMYLNQVYFGHGTYGIEAASQYYFDKHVWELTPQEGCLLAGIPRSPGLYSPIDNPKTAKKRRDLFLKKLYEHKKISKEQYESYINSSLSLKVKKVKPNQAAYFIEEVRRYLETKYGSDFIYKKGVYVYTTIDMKMQRIADIAVKQHLNYIEEKHKLSPSYKELKDVDYADSTSPPPYLQAALVAVDVNTGGVLALVGGRDFKQSSFDRAVQAKRQPGSAFKIFVYTAALDNGFTPGDPLPDLPIVIRTGGYRYAPNNWDFKFMGMLTLRDAVAYSRNCSAIRMVRYLGPELVIEYARKMGIKSPLKPIYSIGLGACEVSPIEMAGAVSTLATEGDKVKPYFVRKIIDREGNLIEENHPEIENGVIPPQTAWLMTNILQDVVNKGTATVIRRRGFKGPAAGKTGTTDKSTDGWFVGFTPRIACAVWVGYDKKKQVYRGASGGALAAPIWAEFMKGVYAADSLSFLRFVMPEGIISRRICDVTGQLATPYCPHTRVEYFKEGTEPYEPCNFHIYMHMEREDTLRKKFEREEEF